MEDFELELKQDFLTEATELLEEAEESFLLLETEPHNPELIDKIFRLAHNLKGTSGAVGFDQMASFTHIAENLILKIKNKELEIDNKVVTLLLEIKDQVETMVNGLKDNVDEIFEVSELIVKMEQTLSGENNSEEIVSVTEELNNNDVEVPDNKFIDIEEVAETENSLSFSQTQVQEEPVEDNIIDINTEAVTQSPNKPVAKKDDKVKSTKKTPEENIRVKLSRIDSLNNIVGELVILQTVLNQRRFEFIDDEVSNSSIGVMGKLFKELQEVVMALRMLPLKSNFQKLNRIVRDTSRALDKEVELVLQGETTEVDKTVLEKISDPLVHIVRNAVDHGLEMPADRLAKGKSEKGIVEILAYHEGSNLVIQVTDDGKGICPEMIKTKAIEKNIISSPDEVSDSQALQFIFHPGFSTKEQVTEVSGRGVGMDVVKTNIEALGGEVKLMSKVNEGSSFKIVLPLTLAIIEGIVVKAQKQKFVIPLNQVYEITQLKIENVKDFSGVAKLFQLRGEVMPLFFINQKLGLAKADEDLEKNCTVIVLKHNGRSYGVVVDDIINQQQIVIKKLGEDLSDKIGIMGSSIMSDGMPALILDLFELFKKDLRQSKAYLNFKQKSDTQAS